MGAGSRADEALLLPVSSSLSLSSSSCSNQNGSSSSCSRCPGVLVMVVAIVAVLVSLAYIFSTFGLNPFGASSKGELCCVFCTFHSRLRPLFSIDKLSNTITPTIRNTITTMTMVRGDYGMITNTITTSRSQLLLLYQITSPIYSLSKSTIWPTSRLPFTPTWVCGSITSISTIERKSCCSYLWSTSFNSFSLFTTPLISSRLNEKGYDAVALRFAISRIDPSDSNISLWYHQRLVQTWFRVLSEHVCLAFCKCAQGPPVPYLWPLSSVLTLR